MKKNTKENILLITLISILVISIGFNVIQVLEYKSELKNKISDNTAKLDDVSALMLGSTRPIAGSTYTLAGSGITSSGASITLQSFTIPQNGYEIQDADLSDTFYITLEPGSTKRQEITSCTTVTQNSNDTATLSGCTRGLSPITPFTTSSTLRFAHAGGTQVIFSDPPQLFNEYVSLANTETISGLKTFSVFPEFSDGTTPTTTNQFATKGYADAIANQGAATSSLTVAGISELATRIESASSTAWGVNDPHVQQSQHASSTPSANAFTDGTVWDIWSDNSGYLSQLWIDLSESFDFTGTFKLDGVDLTGLTASSTGLNTLTTGSSTPADGLHTHRDIGTYFTSSSPITVIGATDQLLHRKTITGEDMRENSVMRITILGDIGGSNTAHWLGYWLGGSFIGSSSPILLSGNTFQATVDIYNQAINDQYVAYKTLAGIINVDQDAGNVSSTNMTIDTSLDQDFAIYGVTLDGSGTITLESVIYELIR